MLAGQAIKLLKQEIAAVAEAIDQLKAENVKYKEQLCVHREVGDAAELEVLELQSKLKQREGNG